MWSVGLVGSFISHGGLVMVCSLPLAMEGRQGNKRGFLSLDRKRGNDSVRDR